MLKKKALGAMIATALTLTGCTTFNETMSPYPDNLVDNKFPILEGMPVSQNHTPYSPSLVCLAQEAGTNTQYLNQYRHTLTVGEIKDLTGKFDYNNGGYKITQGATDMTMSALFKTGAYRLVERMNIDIITIERELTAKKLIRDFDLDDNQRLRQITAGEIIGSEYLIVGSINELNYDISSSGNSIGFSGIGGQARNYVADVGIDLFLVNTKTTQVIGNVSVKKQLVGYETRAGIYRFFDNELFDLSLGSKKQEPIQLAVRSAIEHAMYEFTEKLYGTAPQKCQDLKDKADGLINEAKQNKINEGNTL